MDTRIAIIGIIVENSENIGQLNELIHRYSTYIIGRMGIPYRDRQIGVISLVLDAPNDVISALAGKIGRIPGINSKTLYSKLPDEKHA